MNKLVLALTTASLLALTACGGGGDEDAPVQVNQPTNPNPTPTPTPTPTTDPKAYEPAQESRWTTPTVASGSKETTFKSASATGSRDTADKFNKVSVNGQEMEIYPSNMTLNVGRFYKNKTSDTQLVVGGNSGASGTAYARYGFVNGTKDRTITVFYQGEPTTNMPTTGTATYKGYAIGILPTTTDYVTGEASFDVNFANKKLTGKLSNWQDSNSNTTTAVKDISISSTITGNTFKGDNNQGKFYGNNAQNLAGSFADKNQKLQGAFGANKQ
ncbi:MAG: transferrin-binding protein-like solute binding protein [Neisseriaceae bacterium]|nr:transferrin-binding protein-like solute binding protein [Neisseriaceae bacterium]